MAKFEFECTEIDGVLHPNIEIDGKAELDDLGKYGWLRLNYLREQKPQMYRELFRLANNVILFAQQKAFIRNAEKPQLNLN